MVERWPRIQSSATFVSWKHKGRLRGCLGTFTPLPVGEVLCKYAIASRFRPITKDELPELQVHVSLLSQFEPTSHPHDWQIGVHGVAIKFHDGECAFHATYLPEIAAEEGWSHAETITSLIRKSGYHGTMGVEDLNQMVITRYQSRKIVLTYSEYLESES
ncbi:hypothetical protein PSACC_02327 [Paramicrosporidium saccamoebae]|uniref:AMMECR1 domain-containing protein n=1 Tax=Paramicrosporidium saccamoebae TaxID=1246581 RepID=A0A2H9TJE6_9FUNG|nr:hypothetical protein PSACC_02327 [Paramicrosporidium saccamoebae]